MMMKSSRFVIANALLAMVLLLWPAVVSARTTSRGPWDLSEPRQSATPDCSDGSTIKNLWLVERLNVTYSRDELVVPGNASFTVTNTLANTTERITCNLRANYRCELKGTPGDASLYIWLQINLDVASLSLNQTVSCASGTTSR